MINSNEVPGEQIIQWILSSFLFKTLRKEEGDHYIEYAELAIKHGYDDNSSQTYRSICRETLNHGWHIAYGVSLGVYDQPISASKALIAYSDDQELFREEMLGLWRDAEPMMTG